MIKLKKGRCFHRPFFWPINKKGEFIFQPYMEDEISNYSVLVFNSVFRWEFSPGSTFYLVWTRNTELSSSNEIFELMSNTVDLLIEEAANHLAIKITCWID